MMSESRFTLLSRAVLIGAGTLFFTALLGHGYGLWCGNWRALGSECQYRINPNFLDGSAGSDQAQIDAINRAGATWSDDGGSPFRYTYLGLSAETQVNPGNFRQDIFARNTSNGNALAVTVCNGNSVRFGADVLFYDSGITWAHGTTFDIETVSLHEMGHLLGLDHTGVGGSVMVPSYHGIDRDLGPDDIDGVRAIYGCETDSPDITAVVPSSGEVRGGDIVDVVGTNFDGTAQVLFGGQPATVLSVTGSSTISVRVPAGSAIGQSVTVSVIQDCGNTAEPNAFMYTVNSEAIAWTGSPTVGEMVTVNVYGQPNKQLAVAVGHVGETMKAGFTFCLDSTQPLLLVKRFNQIQTNGVGLAQASFVVPNTPFTNYNMQALIKNGGGGDLVQTNCSTMTVFP